MIAPTTPPIRAKGSVRATRAVSRSERKSAWMIRRMPSSESADRASSRRLDSSRAAYSPRNSGWYSRSKSSVMTRSLTSRATLPRSRPARRCRSRRSAARPPRAGSGWPRAPCAISATSESGTCVPSGVSIGSELSFETSLRTSSIPQMKTSKIFCSRYSSPTFAPLTSVVAARRTSPAVRPSRAEASGRSRTSSCGTSSCGSTFRFVDALDRLHRPWRPPAPWRGGPPCPARRAGRPPWPRRRSGPP